MLALSWRDIDEIREIIRETRELTTRPFGVNLVLEWPQHERLQACLEEGVKIVSFFWGDPAPYIQETHDAGAIVLHTVASAAEARRSVERGADVIVAQGWEAGGHVWGKVASFPLIPQVVDAVAPVPVVAAGGIGDGRGMAAALMLGAAGVWMGTRFLASKEAAVHPFYKEKVLEASEIDAVYSRLFDIGWPNASHRVLRNSTVARWEASGCPPNPHRPGEGEVIASFADGRPIVRYSDVIPSPEMTGDVEALALYAGQSVGLVTGIQSAGEIVRRLAIEARESLEGAFRLSTQV
jgi:NAD(P)H-dependent flavin oxidoreductase YrpB (nitropropane dioxygenase family)